METTNFIENHVSNHFTIRSVHIEEKAFYFIVYDYNRDKFLQLVEDLDKIGYLPYIDKHEENYKINIVNKPKHGESRVHVNIVLFFVTIVSTVSAGYVLGGSILEGIAFSIALLAIVGPMKQHIFSQRKSMVLKLLYRILYLHRL